MSGDLWFADVSDEPEGDAFVWQPFLQCGVMCLPLSIWFDSQVDCENFIATIPAGAV